MKKDKNNKQEPSKIQYMPIGMCIGVSVGMAIGAGLGNIALGMCIGLSVGMCIGSIIDFKNNQKSDNTESEQNEEDIDKKD